MSEKAKPRPDILITGQINQKSIKDLIGTLDRERALLVRAGDASYKMVGISDIAEIVESGIRVYKSADLRTVPGDSMETYEIPFTDIDSVEVFKGEAGLYSL